MGDVTVGPATSEGFWLVKNWSKLEMRWPYLMCRAGADALISSNSEGPWFTGRLLKGLSSTVCKIGKVVRVL